MFRIRIYLIAMLLLSLTSSLNAQQPVVDAIRDAIFSPDCEASCFLGIQPGITSEAEALAILDANKLAYEKHIRSNVDGYAYYVKLPTSIDRFALFSADYEAAAFIDILPAGFLTDYDVVASISIILRPLNISAVVNIMNKSPDLITSNSSGVLNILSISSDFVTSDKLIFVDRQIVFVTDKETHKVQLIYLGTNDNMDQTLMFGDDIRPCEEPAVLCSLKPQPAVGAFTTKGAPIELDWLGTNYTVLYEPGLEVTAQIEFGDVGSVVFSDGTTTTIDNSAPYTWQISGVGWYFLRARPYSEANGQGTAFTPRTVQFTVSEPMAMTEAMRDAILSPDCEASCFLGIQPGITSEADALAILDVNMLKYEKVVVPNMDGYTYGVDLPQSDDRFSLFGYGASAGIEILPAGFQTDYDVVVGITLIIRQVTISDVINIMNRAPDRIASGKLVYVDEQVSFDAYTDNTGATIVEYVRLNTIKGIDMSLIFYPDIRPCEEPIELCNLPRSPSIRAFTLDSIPIGDNRIGEGSNIPFSPTLEITATTDPAHVGSVVFTIGDTTFIDNAEPYTWRIPVSGTSLLHARPYSEADGQGEAGTPLSVQFTVVDSKGQDLSSRP